MYRPVVPDLVLALPPLEEAFVRRLREVALGPAEEADERERLARRRLDLVDGGIVVNLGLF